MTITGERILSTLAADGTLTTELARFETPPPTGSQIVVRVEAAPINPTDLAVLFPAVDVEDAVYTPGRIVARVPDAMARAMKNRQGKPLPVGSECAGTVIAAGPAAAAQALIGERVACSSGAGFATVTTVDAGMAMVLGEGVTSEQGASAFVNPLTALGFVETMRREGFTGLVHTAAASNLGRMLVRICAADGVPLVNVVRSAAQVASLRELGAEHVLDSTQPDFRAGLADAIAATGAMMAFDPIRGGALASQIVTAMEAAARRLDPDAPFTLYGSNAAKRLYVYGALDLSPMVFNPGTDFAWQIGGWLLPSFLAAAGPEVMARLRARVRAELTTTFASHYEARVTLAEMLTPDAVRAYNARKTGNKYLVLPNG